MNSVGRDSGGRSPIPMDETGRLKPEASGLIRDVLREKIIPGIRTHGTDRVVPGRMHYSDSDIPAGLIYTRRELTEQPVRHRRHVLQRAAHWPGLAMESFRYQMLGFVYDGEADLPVGDAILQVPAGYAVIIPAGVPTGEGSAHWCRPHPETASSDILWVHIHAFGAELFTCHTRGLQHYSGWSNRLAVTEPQLLPLFERFMAELDGELSMASTMASSWFLIMLCLLQREWDSNSAPVTGGAFSDSTGRELDDPVVIARSAMRYIDANLRQKLTLESIAAATYVSRSHLAQVFRRETGLTVWQYVTEQRLKKVKALLAETDLSMAEVNRRSGFCRSSHFFTRFAELTGVSPGEYRRKARGEKKEVREARTSIRRRSAKARQERGN